MLFILIMYNMYNMYMSFNNNTYINNYSINGKGVLIPIGSIIILPMTNSSSVPAGFLRCDGSTVNISDYPNLYSVMGTSFGGNGSTNFNLPSYQNKFLYGKANAVNEMNESIGNDSAILTTSNLPKHTHSFSTVNHRHTGIESESPSHARNNYNDDLNNSGGGQLGFQGGGKQQIGTSYGITHDYANAYISFSANGKTNPSSFSIVPYHVVMVFLIKY
jgi:microcystin-dependent protein